MYDGLWYRFCLYHTGRASHRAGAYSSPCHTTGFWSQYLILSVTRDKPLTLTMSSPFAPMVIQCADLFQLLAARGVDACKVRRHGGVSCVRRCVVEVGIRDGGCSKSSDCG